MPGDFGNNAQDIKLGNRRLVLKTIATRAPITRSDVASATGLTKMTMSNIIGELMAGGWVREKVVGAAKAQTPGRPPVYLDISDQSPCALGVAIGRKRFAVVLGDIKGRVLRARRVDYEGTLDQARLLAMLRLAAADVTRGWERPILGMGVAVMGPVSVEKGMLLEPANFFGIKNVPLVALLREGAGYPVFLAPDNCAGALAEKLYGHGQSQANFLFLLLQNGIGCGIIAQDRPFEGHSGLAGELGHTVIRFDGAPCSCGRRGCVEQYANLPALVRRVQSLMGPDSALRGRKLGWETILDAADRGDPAALTALTEFAEYLACALTNYINVFDPETVYLCHEGSPSQGALLRLLSERVHAQALAPNFRRLTIREATFKDQSVEKGALALVASRVFDGELPLN